MIIQIAHFALMGAKAGVIMTYNIIIISQIFSKSTYLYKVPLDLT